MTQKRVLVTGAAGFIGRQVLDCLKAQGGYEIHAVSSRHHDVEQGVFWHHVNLLEEHGLDFLFADFEPESLIHLAWDTRPKKYWMAEENLLWLEASREIIRRFCANGGKRVVAAGTCAEYDWNRDVYNENDPLNPATLYGQCKNDFREFLADFSHERPLSWAWGRVFFCYGPREAKGRLVPSMISKLAAGEAFECQTPDLQRDFLYVKDVARAFVSILESDLQGPVNIGSGSGVLIREMAEAVADELGVSPELLDFHSAPVDNQPPKIIADIEKLKQSGWEPQYSLQEGLQKTITDYELSGL